MIAFALHAKTASRTDCQTCTSAFPSVWPLSLTYICPTVGHVLTLNYWLDLSHSRGAHTTQISKCHIMYPYPLAWMYLHDESLNEVCPELLDEFVVPKYFAGDYLQVNTEYRGQRTVKCSVVLYCTLLVIICSAAQYSAMQ